MFLLFAIPLEIRNSIFPFFFFSFQRRSSLVYLSYTRNSKSSIAKSIVDRYQQVKIACKRMRAVTQKREHGRRSITGSRIENVSVYKTSMYVSCHAYPYDHMDNMCRFAFHTSTRAAQNGSSVDYSNCRVVTC